MRRSAEPQVVGEIAAILGSIDVRPPGINRCEVAEGHCVHHHVPQGCTRLFTSSGRTLPEEMTKGRTQAK